MENKPLFLFLILFSFMFVSCPGYYANEACENLSNLLSGSRIVVKSDDEKILLEKSVCFPMTSYDFSSITKVDLSELKNESYKISIVIKMYDGYLYKKRKYINCFFLSNIRLERKDKDCERISDTIYSQRKEKYSVYIFELDNNITEFYTHIFVCNQKDKDEILYDSYCHIEFIYEN